MDSPPTLQQQQLLGTWLLFSVSADNPASASRLVRCGCPAEDEAPAPRPLTSTEIAPEVSVRVSVSVICTAGLPAPTMGMCRRASVLWL